MAQGQTHELEYSPNFVFPVRELESARVRLTPFNPAKHAKDFFEQTKSHPELYQYYFSVNPPSSAEEFTYTFVEEMMHKDPKSAMFAIIDKTGESPELAGMISLINTSKDHQCTEIGYVMVFPKFQRTHVTSNAVGLLQHYCLELPAELDKGELKYGPGLGLRRVQWQASALNTPSIRCAERMGFKYEGILRWYWVVLQGKPGAPASPERESLCAGNGRHNCILSLCWDDWELEGARELVQQQMDRP